MSPLLQFCAVIVTMAMVVVAVVAVRLMRHFQRVAEEASRTLILARGSLAQMQDVACEAHELLDSMKTIAPPLRRVALKFEELGQRTADISDALLREVEGPVRAAVSVARGMRIGTSFFLDRFTQRLAHRRSAANGGHDHA